MGKKKRVMFLIGQNQYGVLAEMAEHFAAYLEEQKEYEIIRYIYGENLEDFLRDKGEEWDFIFSLLGIEINCFQELEGKRFLLWLVDHPIYHLERFDQYPDKKNLYIGCVDRTHVAYLKNDMGYPSSFFAPHFGWKEIEGKSWGERGCDVFFPASYTDTKQLERENEEWLTGNLKIVLEQIIAYLSEHYEDTLEEGIRQIIAKLGTKDARELALEIEQTAGWYIDGYLRAYVRENVLRNLLAHKIKVTVCGRNWGDFLEKLREEQRPFLDIRGEDMPYTEVLRQMADSKIVLNVLPGFKDGSHERVVMGAMHGAVCVSDRNLFLEEVFKEDRDIVFYDVKNAEDAAKKIKWLLEHPQEAERIAESGQCIAEQEFSVERFSERMLNVLGD